MLRVAVLLHAYQFLRHQAGAVDGGELRLEFLPQARIGLYAFDGVVQSHRLFLVEEEQIGELFMDGRSCGKPHVMVVGEHHVARLVEGVDVAIYGAPVDAQLFGQLACRVVPRALQHERQHAQRSVLFGLLHDGVE